jgi:hypothetical protein
MFSGPKRSFQSGLSSSDARNIASDAMMPLEQRLDELELGFAAIWRLLKNQYQLTDEQLIRAMQEIDASDGAQDGKISRGQRQCPSCKRQALLRYGRKCSWCGADLPPAFTL